MVLSGQHSCLAAKELGETIQKKEDKPRPRWTTHVSATILKHDTLVTIKKLMGGQGQAAQEKVERLKLVRTAVFLYELINTNQLQLAENMWSAAMMGAQKEEDKV